MAGNPGKLNVIWFQDEQPAKRLRLRPGWIRAVSYFLVLAVLGAAGGVFAAWQFWKRAQDAHAERREVEKRLSEALIKLERLQNIEKLLQTSDPTELTQLLAGLGLDLQPAKQPQAKGKDAKEKDSKDKDAKEKAASLDRDKSHAVDLSEIMGKVDQGQAAVENFRARFDAKGLHYSFDLSNLQPQALSGNGLLFAISKDGTMTPVQTGKDDLGFSIQRFKQVQAQAPLPKGLDPGNLFGLRLVLNNASGKTIFSETYPLEKAQQ